MDDKAKRAIVSEFSKQISDKCDRRLVKCAVDHKVSFAFLKLHIKFFNCMQLAPVSSHKNTCIHLMFGPAIHVKLYFILFLVYF
jgi:hypothetical protein